MAGNRRPTIKVDPNGDVDIRVTIPRSIWLLCEAMANKLRFDQMPEVGLRMLLLRVSSLIEQGDANLLGPEWIEVLKRVRSDNFGMLSSGPPIELHRLHRSDKVKSGFTGVYANGQGFRAMGRVPNSTGSKYIGQFDTAEEAAWRRRLYYKEHGLPYGDLEIELDKLRKMGFSGDDEAALREVRLHDSIVGVVSREPGEEDDETQANSEVRMLGFEGGIPPEMQAKLDALRGKR